MEQFIIGFVVYTMGTIGLLLVGYIGTRYFINSMGNNNKNIDKSFLSVEQGLSLEARKTIYVVKAGNQKFLVATTPDSVSCLGELQKDNDPAKPVNKINPIQAPKMHPDLEAKLKYTGFVKDILNKQHVKR